MSTSKVWKTNNVSLAAYLAISFSPVNVEWINKSAYWSFEETEELFSSIDDYHENLALVDPKIHNEMVSELKKQMRKVKDDYDKAWGAE